MMDNFEKVETGLELCTHISPDCCLMLCPYKDKKDGTYSAFCEEVLKHDALKLLKEQQAKIDELIKEASGYAELLIKNGIIKDGEQDG